MDDPVIEGAEDAPLTADEILTFGPVVEAQVWTPIWLEEKRAPIAVAAGRPKFGQVFNSDGVGKAVLIRPCMSRGKRIRGLSPIYTPAMLEANAAVFAGWPMYFDHMSEAMEEALAEAIAEGRIDEAKAKRGRSVKEMGGQVLTPAFDKTFKHEEDGDYGYQPGAVISEVWASPYLRNLVGNNPNLLHTSISAWPTAGKPGKAPWGAGAKGMVIEGIRRQPQGSVDFVPRGGAGGRLLLAEGADPDTSAWPEPGLNEESRRLVVSLATSSYASPAMDPAQQNPNFAAMTPEQFRTWVAESHPTLVPALSEAAPAPAAAAPAGAAASLTAADVERIIESHTSELPTTATIEETITSVIERTNSEREAQRELSRVAERLIENAEGLTTTWKADLKARYAVLPSGPSPALLVEAEEGPDGVELSEQDVLERNVAADLQHCRDLIAEAQGKPRVTGEGGTKRDPGGNVRESTKGGAMPLWRTMLADIGVVAEADDALSIHGVEKEKVEA